MAPYEGSAFTALANSVENLADPFVNGPAGVTTANTYSGLVWIDVTGVGQAAGSILEENSAKPKCSVDSAHLGNA
jgi:hypothetical protein